MVSAVSMSASVEPHLHLDPSLKVKGRCKTCAPGWSNKFFCCVFSCCNSKNSELRNRAIYCDRSGCCKPFDWENCDDAEMRIHKTSLRVAHLVSEKKHLEEVFEETGVDLITKAADSNPITVGELKRVRKVLK